MKHSITKFLMFLAMGGASVMAYAVPGLTITEASYSAPGDIYANAENRITGHTLTVALENTGDADLVPGDEGYSLTLYQTSGPVELQVFQLDTAIPVGETVRLELPCDYSVDPLLEANPGSVKFWSKLSVRENVTSTSKDIMPWRDIYAHSIGYHLCGMNSGVEYKDPISFGFVKEPKTLTYRLRATGTADVVVNSVELPEGFALTNIDVPFTVKGLANVAGSGDAYQALDITFTPTVPGVKAGVIKFNVDGAESKEYTISASYVGPDSFFEGFDTEMGYDYVPKGWVLSDNWGIGYNSVADDDKYNLAHGSSEDKNFNFAITPKLRFSEEDAMTFQAARRSYASRMEVYYSSDRSNWQLLKTINAYGEGGADRFPANDRTYADYVIDNMPAGEWYIGFKGLYVMLNNVFGGCVVPVEHDAMILHSDMPAKVTANNPWQAKVMAKNLADNDETAGNYTVELFVDGKKVCGVEDTPAWASLAEQEFVMSHTFNDAGEYEVFVRLTVGDVVVETAKATVAVKEESADETVEVGSWDGSRKSPWIPLRTNWYNSESQVVFTQEYLAKYGITPGKQLMGLAFDAAASSNKKINTTLTVWLDQVENGFVEASAPYDLADVTPVFSGAYVIDVKNESVPYEIINVSFDAPYVYEGGNLLMSVRSTNADVYTALDFPYDAELNNNSISRYNDKYETFITNPWNGASGTPITKFLVYSQPALMAGKVTDADGAAIAGTEIRLVSGDVVYTGMTDEAGGYSINVFQPALDYVVTVDHPDHPVYQAPVSFAGGEPSGDIVLKDFSNEREFTLTVNVGNDAGISLAGTVFTLVSERFSVNYPSSETVLDENGSAVIDVYGGSHTLTIAVPGMKPCAMQFNVNKHTAVQAVLAEDVRQPYGTSYDLDHNIFTGENTVTLSWNGDEAVFEDDYEGYDAFAINFAPWTGIDVDNVPAAGMSGIYPNRGVVNYGQIINPMKVEPIWDPAMYPTLMGRSGMQYVGFVQTANGMPNNDWLITPAMEIGEDNMLRFSIKSADTGKARFTVGVSMEENPGPEDFTMISEGNYIEADFSDWKTVEISLAEYAGQTVKIGFHCISPSGAFISQLDDVFVGRVAANNGAKARRVAQKSPANPNEKFVIILDGETVGETDGYDFTLSDVKPGKHMAQIVATYLNATAEPVDISFEINADDYVKSDFVVTTNNDIVPEALNVLLTSAEEKVYAVPAADGKASVASLPKGVYTVEVDLEFFNHYSAEVQIDSEMTVDIVLEEAIVAPFNISHEGVVNGDKMDVTVSWNRNYGFEDSFEAYDDFATGTFGGWKTLNNNLDPSYPIGLGSMTNIVSFPGCSTTANMASVPPMVFNPHATVPAMSADVAILAPDGDKSVIFQGPQQAKADKWLISPQLSIYDGYEMSVLAKAYSIYPERLEFMISTTGDSPEDFSVLDVVEPSYSEWTKYTISLDGYAGNEVYLAVHCVSVDGFIVQVDDFRVGREGGEEVSVAGFVKSYDVTLNGESKGSTTDTEMVFPALGKGEYNVGVRSVYASGASEYTTYGFSVPDISGLEDVNMQQDVVVSGGAGVITVIAGGVDVTVYTPAGVSVASFTASGETSISVAPGVYVVNAGGMVRKVTVK